MPVTWSTVHTCLEELGKLKSGDRILIHAASGGVGIVAVQYALRVGAIVYATAGSAEKHATLGMLQLTLQNMANTQLFGVTVVQH